MHAVPEDTQLLVTHQPSHGDGSGKLSALMIGGDGASDVGSRAIAEKVSSLPQLVAHVCGHIHEARGVYGKTHNVSYVDLRYHPYALPIPIILAPVDPSAGQER